MPVDVVIRPMSPTSFMNTSMSVLPVLAPPDWDPSFHGSVHTATLTVCTVLVIFVVILGTFGNGLVLLSALQCRRLRSNFDMLIFNLAGADFIISGCLSATFLYLLFSNPPSPREFCGGFLFTSTLCGLLSLLTLVAIAAHRESRVRGRLKGALSTTRTAFILSIIYIISIGTALGGTLHVTLSWTQAYTTCQAVINSNDITTNNVILFFVSPIIIISFTIIVISYSIIARAVRVQTYLRVKALQPLLKPPTSVPVQNALPIDSASIDVQKILVDNTKVPRKNEPLKHCTCCSCMVALDKENKAVTMCFVVIVIIALCWAPLVISHILEMIIGESIILYQVKICGIALVFLNSALNPYLYAQNRGRIKKKYGRFFWNMLRCECQMPNPKKFQTLLHKRPRTRSLGKSMKTQDFASVRFLHPKSRKILKNCDSLNKNAPSMKDQRMQSTHKTYTQNVLLYGGGTLRHLSLDSRRPDMSHNRKLYAQNGRISDVRSLVHKTCCHAHSPDNQSLVDS
ncbi:unnamed protein product [Candidula unifasciata]|uniref:G-protein coupled receptors family 1 profile domain-containing protein n=1 Tax=Candidula unifasciata TaxID=100452 RepID=A0A8S3Z2E5_9EUPU|nr:unnamed protein product [Candidula unifasciata]